LKPISESRLQELLGGLGGKRVLVVGDISLYEYVWGRMTGISTEAPVPVVDVRSRTFAPGAAGNTAVGLARLGAAASLCGWVGDDPHGRTLTELLRERGVDTSAVVAVKEAATNAYTKISAGGYHSARQEVLRTHTMPAGAAPPEAKETILTEMKNRAGAVDAVILVDQTGATVTRRVVDLAVDLRRKHQMIVVGDSRDNVREMRGIDLVGANDYEAGLALGEALADRWAVEGGGQILLAGQELQNLIITRGMGGMSVFSQGSSPVHLRTHTLEVFDVTGAGDTVTAVTTLALLAGASAVEAAQLANLAAGVAVSKVGTVAVSADEILATHAHYTGIAPSSKIKTLEELKGIVAELRKEGCKIAWTNGCFDILHSGHIAYLRKARQQADVLLVGVSGDRTVAKLKGEGRPVNDQRSRAELLAEMASVDYVIIFEEDTPAHIIEALKPDVYVKGGDYTIDTINQTERRVVESYGGGIELLGHVEGTSTTDIIARILRQNQAI